MELVKTLKLKRIVAKVLQNKIPYLWAFPRIDLSKMPDFRLFCSTAATNSVWKKSKKNAIINMPKGKIRLADAPVESGAGQKIRV